MSVHEFMLVLLGFAVGGKLAMWITDRRWQSNATTYLRIESGGRLYKVHYADNEAETVSDGRDGCGSPSSGA